VQRRVESTRHKLTVQKFDGDSTSIAQSGRQMCKNLCDLRDNSLKCNLILGL